MTAVQPSAALDSMLLIISCTTSDPSSWQKALALDFHSYGTLAAVVASLSRYGMVICQSRILQNARLARGKIRNSSIGSVSRIFGKLKNKCLT